MTICSKSTITVPTCNSNVTATVETWAIKGITTLKTVSNGHSNYSISPLAVQTLSALAHKTHPQQLTTMQVIYTLTPSLSLTHTHYMYTVCKVCTPHSPDPSYLSVSACHLASQDSMYCILVGDVKRGRH